MEESKVRKSLLGKLTIRLVSLFVLAMTMVAFIAAWMLIIGHQNTQQVERTLPATQKALQQSQSLNKLNQIYRQLNTAQSAEYLIEQHQQLTEAVKYIASPKQKQFLYSLKEKQLTRLTEVNAENFALKVQLVDALNVLNTSEQANSLYQQASELTLQTPLVSLQIFERNLKEYVESSTAHENLTAIAFNDQRVISRWRGAIRLYQEYKQQLGLTLTPVFGTEFTVQNHTAQLPIITWLQSENIKLSQQELATGLLVSAIVSLLFFIVQSINLRLLIKQHHQQQKQNIAALIAGENVSAKTQELADVVAQVKTVAQPLHTEKDYQQLAQSKAELIAQWQQLIDGRQWQLKKGQLSFNDVLVKDLPDSNYQHWCQLLGFSQTRLLLKELKANDQVNLPLQLSSGESIRIIAQRIDSSASANNQIAQAHWQGVILNNAENSMLVKNIEELKKQKKAIKRRAYVNAEQQQQHLAQMLVQAMLQNQNLALVNCVSVQSLYRPLMRMFERIRQQQVQSELLYSQLKSDIQDVNFIDELEAAFINAKFEALLQQNNLYLDADINLRALATINTRLFHRLIADLCRVVLQDCYKEQLLLKLQVIDQDAGQQQVKITATVETSKALTKLPSHLTILNEIALSEKKSYKDSYLITLLKYFHARLLQVELTTKGYEISFELPINAVQSHFDLLSSNALAQAFLLVIGDNKQTNQTIESTLKHAGANVELLSKPALFAQQFPVEHFNRHKLNLVVLAGSDQHLPNILTHIDSLPASKQPRTVVLQDINHNALITSQGLYSLTSAPISRKALVAECLNAIANKQESNLQISAKAFAKYQFMPSQVELLLAVKSPSRYSNLYQLLHWLGFHIKLVCQSKMMQKHWQSGRYLVLINELDASPYIEMDVGKTIARGVFTLTEQVDEVQIMALEPEQAEISKNWHLAHINRQIEIDDLIAKLSPWLTVKTKANKRVAMAQANVGPFASVNAFDSQQFFNHTLSEHLPSAFDLAEYADNQGSAELAVYMLDEYILTLNEQVHKIEVGFIKINKQMLESGVQTLLTTARIIAAKGLVQLVLQLEQALVHQAYDKMERILAQIKLEISAVSAYAEAI